MTSKTTENVNEEPRDISLAAYLNADDTGVVGRVRTRHGFVRIAALSEDEVEELRKACDKPDPRRGRGATKFDDQLFKSLVAAKSLHKADPSVDMAQLLASFKTKLAGDVTTFAAAAIKLSGFDDERVSEIDTLVGFTS